MDLSFLQRVDVFSKTKSTARVRTREGAILSLVALLFMGVLVITEFSRYMSGHIETELSVDTSFGAHIQINLDVTFYALPCAFISVNAMDKSGDHQLDVRHNIYNTRINKNGEPVGKIEREHVGSDQHEKDFLLEHQPPCGNCYGAETQAKPCCNTCEQVSEAYRAKGWAFSDPHTIEQCVKEKYVEHLKEQKEEGCRVKGYLIVNRVQGNFNIVPGKFILQNSRYVVDSKLFSHINELAFNTSHRINHLSFGEEYPGMQNPLDGREKVWHNARVSPMYEYFVKIVPTVYRQGSAAIETNQFSVIEYVQTIGVKRDELGVSGFFVMYDLSPVTVTFSQSSNSFLHFLTHLCAIIGGIYTIFSLIDAFYYSGLDTIKTKLEIGKQI